MHSARTYNTIIRKTAQGFAWVLPTLLLLTQQESGNTGNGNNNNGNNGNGTVSIQSSSSLMGSPMPMFRSRLSNLTQLQQDLWNFQLFTTAHCESAALVGAGGSGKSSQPITVPIDKTLYLTTATSHDVRQSSCKEIASHTYNANNPSEDRHVYGAINGWAFGGVFDGHGGWQVSDVVSQVLVKLILQKVTTMNESDLKSQETVANAIIDAFEDMEAMIVQSIRPAFQFGFGDLAKVGSCVLVALKRNNQLFVANCGDCRAVLGSTESADPKSRIVPTQINHEHNCRQQLEQQRLREAHPNESDLVICKNSHACYVKGRLQLTRSIGDCYLKYHEFNGDKTRMRGRHIPEPYTPPYVSHTPDVIQVSLESRDRFLILGTDGLWDYISNEEAVQIVHDGMLTGMKESEVASRLVERALAIAAQESGLTLQELKKLNPGRQRRSHHDDTTAVVMYFK